MIAKRWGPFFNHLFRENQATQERAETATLRPSTIGHPSRNSSITITPSVKTTTSNATTLFTNDRGSSDSTSLALRVSEPPDPSTPNPLNRPRTFYLPHTLLTVQALVHYLYTASLPQADSYLCTPQILCSLLQLARPYRIDGLLECVIERLHAVLDGRNTAAIFNAAAMAAGGGNGVSFFNGGLDMENNAAIGAEHDGNGVSSSTMARYRDGFHNVGPAYAHSNGLLRSLRIDTSVGPNASASAPASAVSMNGGYGNGNGNGGREREDDEHSSVGTSDATSLSDFSASAGLGGEREVWTGELSSTVGLQKRGLRGLMEGRRIREMGSREVVSGGDRGDRGGGGGGQMVGSGSVGGSMGSIAEARVGLGIA
ncbi:hypothetical protein LTS18_004668 [Coniosporium uncinatum]|uniref:Uncharacterized protein n=1 Tax=Coniosporium uncinatum TaxID=93489 RepID=A0ACC3D5F3_9PEZI|nr:hypothetical protein LTS18_004668 [Coniosporium uncinatum]